MKIKDLIEKLKQFDPEMEVVKQVTAPEEDHIIIEEGSTVVFLIENILIHKGIVVNEVVQDVVII